MAQPTSPTSEMASHLNNEEFFNSLTNLLIKTSTQARGSIFLTQKSLLNSTTDETTMTQQPSILIRATDGNTNAPNPKTHRIEKKNRKDTKVKISTVVAPSELEGFYARYAEVCKAGMTGLKKRDRKKAKAKAKGKGPKA